MTNQVNVRGNDMTIDHVGIVVRSMEKGIELWTSVFGYQKMTEMVVNTRQKVKVVFLKKKDSVNIKLIEPTEHSSSVYALAQRGGGLHHLCFKCNDLNAQLDGLPNRGLRVLTPPEPGEAFQNEKIAFVFAGQGLNIELIDTAKRAGVISE